MMSLYFVKKDLFGVKAGTVERFAHHKAGAYVLDGSIEPYDEKKHGSRAGAPPYEAKRRAEREQKKREEAAARAAVQTSAQARR